MESKKNRSRTYLVPLLDEDITIHKSLLINTYLFDIEYPEYNMDKPTGLFIHLRWTELEVHKQYEYALLNSKQLKLHYEVDTESYMVFLEFNPALLADVGKLIQGQYSKVSDNVKRTILKYWSLGMGSDLYGTLYKTKARKEKLEEELGITLSDDAELASVFNLSEEVFDKRTVNSF